MNRMCQRILHVPVYSPWDMMLCAFFFSLYGTSFRNKEEEGTVNHLWRDMGLSEVRQMFSLSSRRVTFHL